MNYFEQNKKSLKDRDCCKFKKSLNQSEIKKMLEKRKKYVVPEHVETIDGNIYDAHKSLTETKGLLKERRKYAAKKIEELTAQWNKLRMNELEFRGVVEQFNDSTIQIREKITREKQKIINMRETINARNKAIDKMNEDTQYLSKIVKELKTEMEKHIIYEDFVSQFAERYDFKQVGEVLQRYIVLLHTKEDVLLKLERTSLESLKFKLEYKKFLHEFAEKAVKLSDVLTQQMKKYDEVTGQARQWEGVVYAVIIQMQKRWTEINSTRGALEQIICLLLLRLHPREPIEVTCTKENFQNILSMKTDHLSQVNKRLGDLENLRIKANTLLEENKLDLTKTVFETFDWWDDFTRKSQDLSQQSQAKSSKKDSQDQQTADLTESTSKTYSRYPQLSACTAKTIEDIRLKLFGAKKWERLAKRKQIKTDSSSDTVSIAFSEAKLLPSMSESTKSRAFSNWELLLGLGDMTDEKLMATMAYLGPIDGKATVIDEIPDKPHTCSSLTADPLAKMPIDTKINSRGRSIVERNFDRYEKKWHNPLKQDSSSVLKFNKETGILELPRLNIRKHQPPHEIKKYLALKEGKKSILPDLSPRTSTAPRHARQSKLHAAPRKYSKSRKPSGQDQHKRNTFDNINAFLHIPAIGMKYNTENL